jgi:hypothetical protein
MWLFDQMPPAEAIASVTVHWRHRNVTSEDNVYRGGVIYGDGSSAVGPNPTIPGTSYVDASWAATAPAGGWTTAEINASQFGVAWGNAIDNRHTRCTTVFVRVVYDPVEEKVTPARLLASMILRIRRRAPRILEVTVPLRVALDVDFLQDVAFSDFRYPTTGGGGLGTKSYERGVFRILGIDIDPMQMTGKLTLLEMRRLMVSLWDVGRAVRSQAEDLDSIARLSTQPYEFRRNSVAWGEDPESGLIRKVGVGQLKALQGGTLFEGHSNNIVKNSNFNQGVATTWGGVGSPTIEADTGDLFFDASETEQSMKVTVPSSPTAGGDGASQTTNTIANAISRLSIDRKSDTADDLFFRLQRSNDSQFFNDSTGGWGASSVDNSMGQTTVAGRFISKQIPAPGASTTYVIEVFGKTGDQVFHVYQVQIEQNDFATSRIVTQGVAVTREPDLLKIGNSDAFPRTLHPERYTYRTLFTAEWDSADLASGAIKRIYRVAWDASNEESLYYDGDNGRFVLERILASTSYKAFKSHTVVRGTQVLIAARATSGEGELELSDYTLSVLVDGVKGTDASPGGAPTLPSAAELVFGQKGDDTEALDGFLEAWEISPFVLKDAECGRAP